MSASGLFLFIAFLVAVGVIVAWPIFLRPKPATPEPNLTALNQLRAQHEAILQAIRDLDFDHQVGKLQETDYQTQREILMQRGIDTLKALDSQQSDLIEASVREYRATAQNSKN